MLFNLLKQRIELLQAGSNLVTKEELEEKINVFYTMNCITLDQYTELMNMLNPVPDEPEKLETHVE